MSCLPAGSLIARSISHVTTTGTERILRSRGWRWTAGLAILLIGTLASSAQAPTVPTFSALQPVGSSSTAVPVTVIAAQGGSVANVEVLTEGSGSLDFAQGVGSTCPTASLSATQTCIENVVFTPTAPGLRQGAVVLLDSNGNVMGTTFISGIGQGGLPVLQNGNWIPVAGSGAWEEVEDGSIATSADLNQPASVALDGAGDMFIADSAHNRIRRVDATTHIISTIAGTGTASYTGDGGPASSATLSSPSGVAVDGAGNIYIADTANNVIRRIDGSTGIITTYAGNGKLGDSNANNIGDGGAATAANIAEPWGVSVDVAGNLFIADTANNRIRRVDVNTGIITTVAGKGTVTANNGGAFSGDGGPAISAELWHPHAVAFDASGAMYIPDEGNNRIRKVSTSGTISTIAGSSNLGYAGDGGTATQAELWAPEGVAVDVAGNVYISDTQNNAVRKVSIATGLISTVVVNAKGRDVWQNSLYGNALYGPMGLAIDGNGNIYVADYFFMKVRQIQSNTMLVDFTSTAVRQGDISTAASSPAAEYVENDGNAPFALTALTAGANAAINPTNTTCAAGNSLAVLSTCEVVAQFAPTKAGNPLLGEVDLTDAATQNPALAIQVVGDATAVNSTTITLTSSPNPSKYGQVVTMTATVSTGAGTGALTGTVTFIDGTTNLVTGVKVTPTSEANYYTATFSTPGLAVGSHTLSALYSGDNLHLPTDTTDPTQVPVVTQIVDELTSTTVSSSLNPSATGSNLTLSAKVSILGGGGITPDGTVTFFDGTNQLGTVTLAANGVAALTTSALTGGVHSITATYSGDQANYIIGSTSGVLSQDVQDASTTSVTSTPNPSIYGTSVTFTATVTTANNLTATGSVAFLDGATQIGTAVLSGSPATATFSTSALTAGSHAITVTYAGGNNAGPGTSAPIIQVVNLTSTVTTLSASPNPGIAGKPVVLTAAVQVTAGSATVTGNVTFSDGTTTLATTKLGPSGTASISQMLAPGPHAIVASYSGDSNDNPSASTAVPLAVNLATTAVGVTSSASPATVLSPVTFTATVTGNGGTPTGSVTFYADGASVSTSPLSATGTASYTNSTLAVGSHTITASYTGDTNDASASSAPLTEAVQAISTVTSLGTSTTGGTTPQLILVASITGQSGPIPTGTVTFTNGSQTIGTSTLDAGGAATLVPDLATGNYNVVASYSGDAVHAPSTSGAIPVTGAPEGFSISITPATLSMSSSQNATVTVSVTSNNGFADTIGLGCATLPANVNCHFSSESLGLKSGSKVTAQLTIDTNTPPGGGSSAMNVNGRGHSLTLAGLFMPASLLFGFAFWRFRKRHSAVFGAVIALLLTGAFMMTGCGGFTQTSAVPGTYTIQVTGVGTASNISHYQNITLTITK